MCVRMSMCVYVCSRDDIFWPPLDSWTGLFSLSSPGYSLSALCLARLRGERLMDNKGTSEEGREGKGGEKKDGQKPCDSERNRNMK